MRYGIKTAPQHCTWQDMLDIWRLADDIELFESAWNFDHFYPLVGDTLAQLVAAVGPDPDQERREQPASKTPRHAVVPVQSCPTAVEAAVDVHLLVGR